MHISAKLPDFSPSSGAAFLPTWLPDTANNLFHICNTITFGTMKKGIKLTDSQYYLEIKDLQYRPIFSLGGIHSLREAVRLAADHVQDMDNYAKVYRELKAMQGAFVGAYLLPGKKVRHAFLIIAAYELTNPITDIELVDEAEQIEMEASKRRYMVEFTHPGDNGPEPGSNS